MKLGFVIGSMMLIQSAKAQYYQPQPSATPGYQPAGAYQPPSEYPNPYPAPTPQPKKYRGGEYSFEVAHQPSQKAGEPYAFIGPELFGPGYRTPYSIWQLTMDAKGKVTGTVGPLKYAKGRTYDFHGEIFGRPGINGYSRIKFQVTLANGRLVAVGVLSPDHESDEMGVSTSRPAGDFPLSLRFENLVTINPDTGARDYDEEYDPHPESLFRRDDGFGDAMLINGKEVEQWDILEVVADPEKLAEAAKFLNERGYARVNYSGGLVSSEHTTSQDLLTRIVIETSRPNLWDDIITLRKSGLFVTVESVPVEKSGPGQSTEDKLVIDSSLICNESGRPDADRIRAMLTEALAKIVTDKSKLGKIIVRDLKITSKSATIRLQGPESILAGNSNKRIDDLEFRCVITQDTDDPPGKHRLFFSYVAGMWADAPVGGGVVKDGWFITVVDSEVCRMASERLVVSLAQTLKGRAIIGVEENWAHNAVPYTPPVYEHFAPSTAPPQQVPGQPVTKEQLDRAESLLKEFKQQMENETK